MTPKIFHKPGNPFSSFKKKSKCGDKVCENEVFALYALVVLHVVQDGHILSSLRLLIRYSADIFSSNQKASTAKKERREKKTNST